MNVLFATSEAHPLVKTGGLGDVSGALPKALAELGVDVRLLLPGYPSVLARLPDAHPVARLPYPFGDGNIELREGRLPGSEVPVLAIVHGPSYDRPGGPYQDERGHDWPDNAERFALLSWVAARLASAESPLPWRPDLLHANDWQTGLAPAYARYAPVAHAPCVMTIHNLAYQGNFSATLLPKLELPQESFHIHGLEFYGQLSFLKAGLYYADWLTTVSPTYAREIQQEDLGFGLHGLLRERADRLSGILNGIDTREWDPAHDPHLARTYSARSLARKRDNKLALQARLGLAPDAKRPLIGVISRITYQKGSDVVLAVAHEILELGAQLAILGTGERELEDALVALSARHPGGMAVTIGYDEGLAHLIEAGADLFLMPSRYEPCGLNQMYSQRYGTPPIVHATGGLADTVTDATATTLARGCATGFVFHGMHYEAVIAAVRRALALYPDRRHFQSMQRAGMARDFSWSRSAREYLALYRRLAKSQ